MTPDYLTLEPASPALLLGPLLTQQPVTGTGLPADTGPHELGCPAAGHQEAVSWTLNSPGALTTVPPDVPVWAPGPSLQHPLNAPLLQSRIYSLSVTESFTPQMSTTMSTCDGHCSRQGVHQDGT